MVEHTSSSAACRHEMEPENQRPLDVPLDDSLVLLDDLKLRFLVMGNLQGTFATSRFQEQELKQNCRTGLPTPHRLGSFFWSISPYFIPEHYFFTYLTAIETLVSCI